MKANTIIVVAAVSLILTGCVASNPRAAFEEMNQSVSSRTGQTAHWTRVSSSNQVDAQMIAQLLKTNLTAQSTVTIALLNNRSLQAEFEEIGISQADVAQASRLHNPQLLGSWRFPNRPPSLTDVEYSATGDVLDLLTLPARRKISERNLQQVQLQIAGKVLQLSTETQTAFYQLQSQSEFVQRLQEIVEANAAGADLAQRQYDAGNINELALRTQQASAAQTRLELMQTTARGNRDRERLNRLLGLTGNQIHWQIAEALPPLPEKELALENLEALAVKQRLDLAASRSRLEGLAAALRLKAHTRFVPGITVGVDTERTPDGQRVTGPTLGVELPVFDHGQPALARLTAEFQQAQNNYAAQEINVRSEVREASAALLAARDAAQFSQKNLLPLRRQILGETLLQYNAMQKSGYDLLAAKERELSAEQTRIEALRDYWNARVALENAVGGRLAGGVSTPAAMENPSPMPVEHEHPHAH